MEDIALDEEGEDERGSVRNDAMTIFRGHSGIVLSKFIGPQCDAVLSSLPRVSIFCLSKS